MLNSHFKQTTCITKRLLHAQVKAWLISDMMAFLPALEKRTTRAFRRVVVKSVTICNAPCFSVTTWRRFLKSRLRKWVSVAASTQHVTKKRRGGHC